VRSFRTRSLVVIAGFAAIPALAACGSSSSSSSSTSASASSSSSSITVTSTDTTCDISSNNLKAGETVFAVSNKGSQVTEVYVYGKEGDSYSKIIAEVEGVGPGTSRDLTAQLAAGTYELACKPGETGNGIRTTLTVTS
jgi:uncharacterized cupredoxin-like copper-binding protein